MDIADNAENSNLDNDEIMLSGVAMPEAIVEIWAGGRLWGICQADQQGNWEDAMNLPPFAGAAGECAAALAGQPAFTT